MFRVIKNLFSSNPANVLIDGFLSPEFHINRGVLQGSKLGPLLFNLFINRLLECLNNSNLGAAIGDIQLSALGFADDIALATDCPIKAQKLLDLCQTWARTYRMTFSTSKCKVMVFNGPSSDIKLELNGENLKIVDSYKYLGVTLTSKHITNLFKTHFKLMLEKAKVRVSTIQRYGFREGGLRLASAIRLYKLLVRPILEYCAQTLTYTRYSQQAELDLPTGFAKEIEHFQTQTLKRLINCPRNTPPAIVRLFCGVEPIACRLEFLKLRYYWRALHSPPENIKNRILSYRKRNLLSFNKGFGHQVFNICCKYNAMNIWHGIVPEYLNPLQSIKRIILSANLRKDLEIGRTHTCGFTTIFLSNPFEYQKNYHIVEPLNRLDYSSFPNDSKVFIKSLLDPNSYLKECQHCGLPCKDMLTHFLTECQELNEPRRLLNLKLSFYNFPQEHLPLEKNVLLTLVFNNTSWRKCLGNFLNESGY